MRPISVIAPAVVIPKLVTPEAWIACAITAAVLCGLVSLVPLSFREERTARVRSDISLRSYRREPRRGGA
jgi:hypothetical protein